jgi:SAM-dependent methyltransferase
VGPKAIAKRLIWLAAQVPALRPVVIAGYNFRPSGTGWDRKHPYDRAHGTRTSGVLPGFLLRPGDPLDAPTTAYGATQPSIVRTALAAIPDPRHCQFVDFGCGKGRPLLVATEFGFPIITGLELSPTLSRIARRNAGIFSRAHPDRTRIDIVTGDAFLYKLPERKLVVFFYRSFDRPLTARLLVNIETSLRAAERDLYVVSYNPTYADLFDASPLLERRYAAQIPCDPSELGYSPDESDAVVIWQNRGNPHPRPPGNPSAPVTIVTADWRAEIGKPPSQPHPAEGSAAMGAR